MNIRHQAERFVNASQTMVDLRDLVFNMLSLLFDELHGKGGMAGDDEAGRAFAAVYKPAVKAVFDGAGHAHQVMANGAGALLTSAENFLKTESKIAKELLEANAAEPDIGYQPRHDCSPRSSHQAEDLPEVVGETSWTDQHLLNSRFHGQRDKLRDVAGSWRAASIILNDAYWDSEAAWTKATLDQAGETADAAENFFRKFVGKNPPPTQVSEDETLMANLPTACKMLANACEAYADHIETALQRLPEESNPITGEIQPIWERPMFGGDGPDGGLHELLASDTRINRLGHIPPALDTAQSRVKMPQPDGGGLFPNLPGFLAPLVRVPVMIPAAYRPPVGPRVQPIPPPTPQDPRFPTLTSPQQQNFGMWLNSLRAGDVSGGKPAEIAYQKRVAGYPEYEVPIPPGISKNSTLMVDGFRNRDGMAIEAKYVNNPQKKCYRSLDELRANHQSGKKDFLYDKDRKELAKYAAALNDPRNTEMRGVETVTNNQDSVAYWRIMMAAYGVKGYARYVP
ncbi:restriction endonuclease fold toxin-2 domain-containing protein [Streptomyces cavernicola]|uniref:Restriction endonuclease fold toxin-2 domain-containing protein n=1 Tax=Streptomyces cavernicola TaxID=3043613 RepID=A0ABT6S435_9ACTN|nr:restriction endonuclease fold toxin-2 domain-containing protein [Streptomyces sp. B-S-A6]MDI3402857.1 restriction endonuclease fold toxin-2 domain-containing protein [Streptomyces sp. B-S-A6]